MNTSSEADYYIICCHSSNREFRSDLDQIKIVINFVY